MVNLVWIIGAIITVWGIVSIIKPLWMKNFVVFLSHQKRFYLAGIFRLIIGVIFLLFARETRWPVVIFILGILFLLGGILVFVLPAGKLSGWINWWIEKPLWVYRIWGIAAALIGGLIMYAGVPEVTV